MKMNSLRKLNPCADGLAFAESHKSLQAAWDACERGDWMLWLIGRTDKSEPWSEERKPIVACACECARVAWEHMPQASRDSLGVIEAWTRGEATRSAAAAAAYSAYAAYAAYAAVAAYAAARAKTLARCADIVRRHYPEATAKAEGGAA
jgi:hypothetical protein